MPGLKTFATDEVLTAANMTTYLAQQAYVVKSVDETVTSSTVLQADNELTIAVSANTKYHVELILIYRTLAAADLQLGWTGPASATMAWVADDFTSAATANVGPVARTLQAITGGPSAGGVESVPGTGDNLFALPKGMLEVAGTAGSLTFRWAQLASNATGSVVLAGSTLILTRIS
jgi:hypothetical protein